MRLGGGKDGRMERRARYEVAGPLFRGLEVLEGDEWSATEREEAAEWGEWARAYELWLSDKAPNTRRAYERAWDDLVEFVVLRGLQRKGRRGASDGRGLSASTINLWLTAVSSFYRFVTTRYTVRADDGRERPLHGYNPALAVRRPKVESYAKADFLNAEDLRALLRAIPRNRVSGLRDCALFLGYVLTGRRNSEWRTIQWHDLTARGTRIFYTWRGKRTEHGKNELPPPVWEAIRDYLDAAGRLGAMQPGDYVFTPLTDHAVRLPNVSERTWNGSEAVSAPAVNKLLKKYARKAGLDARRIQLRLRKLPILGGDGTTQDSACGA